MKITHLQNNDPTRTAIKAKHKSAFAALQCGKQILLAAALVGALASTVTRLVAQDSTNVMEKAKPAESPERPDYYPFTVGIGGGTEGLFGGSVAWRFSDHVGMRAGAGYTEWSMGDTSIAGINYNVKVK